LQAHNSDVNGAVTISNSNPGLKSYDWDDANDINFRITKPKIKSVFPKFLLLSSVYKQKLEITGSDLFTGKSREIMIGPDTGEPRECVISKNTNNTIECFIEPYEKMNMAKISLVIDEYQVEFNQPDFKFVEMPKIKSISPYISLPDGGFNITIIGRVANKNSNLKDNSKFFPVIPCWFFKISKDLDRKVFEM
jgi:hypothetical protein